MAMSSDEGLNEVHHPDEVYQNEASQNSNNSGYPTLPSSYGCSTSTMMSDLLFVVPMHEEPTRTKIIEVVQSAMEELSKIGVAGRPLWVPQKEERREALNDMEYLRQFGELDQTLRDIMTLVEVNDTDNYFSDLFDSIPPDNIPPPTAAPKSTMQIEASRDMAYVNITPIDLVELLMDVNQWSKAFYNLVSQAKVLGTLSDGVEGSHDGKVHVMCAEYHLPSPLVPTREYYFARYCKQLPNDTNEMWGVVDVSLEKPFPSLTTTNLQRRPSGCLITGMPNGHSKVIWLEHVEADDREVNNEFRTLVTTGSAFGATRWLNSLVRHIEFSEIMKAPKTPIHADHGINILEAGRKSFLKLADRMMRYYCADVNASVLNPWIKIDPMSGYELDVRVMVKNNVEDPGMPVATNVVLGTTVWLNVSQSRLFNFLRREDARSKWDVLSHTRNIHTSREFAYINKGNNPGNRVSLMRTTIGEDKTEIIYLQESYTDSTNSYVIYAPIDEFALWGLANGMDPADVTVLPSGFSILPAGDNGVNNGNGSLLTILFHVIESFNIRPHIPPESLVFIRRLIAATVTCIKDAVLYMNLQVDKREED